MVFFCGKPRRRRGICFGSVLFSQLSMSRSSSSCLSLLGTVANGPGAYFGMDGCRLSLAGERDSRAVSLGKLADTE